MSSWWAQKGDLAAGGHLTDTPVGSVYSSIVSLQCIRLLTFIAKLNDLAVWATDTDKAYFEKGLSDVITGPEFSTRQGHTLVIIKAFHGLNWKLKSLLTQSVIWCIVQNEICALQGRTWHLDTRLWQSQWMDSVAAFVGNLLIASKDPSKIIKGLSDSTNSSSRALFLSLFTSVVIGIMMTTQPSVMLLNHWEGNG